MKRVRISRGGQISVPAEIRRRWGTSTVAFDDRGDHVVLSPAPDDPIAAARGALAGDGPGSTALRTAARDADAAAERRRTR